MVHLLARAVIRKANRVLVVQAKGQPHTFLPGGHREAGEGMRACLRRELREELGVESRVERYLGGVEHSWRRDGERQYEINHCYATTSPALTADTPPQAQEGYLSFVWAPVDQLDRVSLQPPPLRALLAGTDAADAAWWGSTVR